MKYTKHILAILLLFFSRDAAWSQYEKGQALDVIQQEWTMDLCSVLVKNDSVLPLSQWMKIHRGMLIEVNVHSEKLSTPSASGKLTNSIAQCISKDLLSSGIDSRRFTVLSKGDSEPLIHDSTLAKISGLEERKKEALKNRRIEIKIISTSFKPFFSYHDKEFFPGQTFDPVLSGQLSRNLEFLFRENSVRDPFAHPDDIVYSQDDRKKDSAFKVLNLLAVMLVANPTVKVSCEIHSSTEGSSEKNLSLTSSQGEQIKKYLISRGVHPAQLTFIPMGEKSPVIPEKEILKLKPDLQKKAHKNNQRVVVTITGSKA